VLIVGIWWWWQDVERVKTFFPDENKIIKTKKVFARSMFP
jgi:hypothetical protein